ncbi:MAG: Gfo/Idh/MocA family protein [Sphingomicrobium sp.]
MRRLRVGLLGCGGIGGRHAGAVKSLSDRMELVACCGRDLERTRTFAQAHGGEAFVDLDRMLDEGMDLLIATLPPYNRHGEIEHAAARGVHLLIEKPIALDMESAIKMVDAVEAAGVVAAIGFMYRFGDAVRRWRTLDTGPVGLYVGGYYCNALHAHWWRKRQLSGGQILEQAIHQIDLIRHLVGEPDSVYARYANLFHGDVPDYDVEDVSATLFGWDDGRIASLTASNIAIPGVWHKEWTIMAKGMTGRFQSWNEALLTRTTGDGAAEDVAGTTDPFVAQLADVGEAIVEKRAPYIPLSEGAKTLRLALAAVQSGKERRELRLAD